ncbi:hypothetical protein SADUNF_Sadunf02G0142900 [Salix dunnii]|uniref:UDP-N-acetylglucosamine transferase subunit ALG14 n=1 Tax=Salix dunnii TaxID=1413687 RepID=A0A835THE6_9ROSI|nr:hypothetical protein SADUNF_Sadunf02G0142900 [Salix dunnii]
MLFLPVYSMFCIKITIEGVPVLFMQIYKSREVSQSYLTSVGTISSAMSHAPWLMIRIRPQLVLSNGPGACVPLFNCTPVQARVKKLSLSGLLLYWLCIADKLFVQWLQLQRKHPQSHYVGCLMRLICYTTGMGAR